MTSKRKSGARLMELEQKFGVHDAALVEVIETLHQLLAKPESNGKRSIGFAPWKEG